MKKFSLHWCALLLLAVSMASRTFAQSNSKEWNDLVQKAKGQPLVLGVHALEGHADVIKEFQKKFPDIKVQYSEMSMSTRPRSHFLTFAYILSVMAVQAPSPARK